MFEAICRERGRGSSILKRACAFAVKMHNLGWVFFCLHAMSFLTLFFQLEFCPNWVFSNEGFNEKNLIASQT